MEKVEHKSYLTGVSLRINIEQGDDLSVLANEKIKNFVRIANDQLESTEGFVVKKSYFVSSINGLINTSSEISITKDELYNIDEEDDEVFGADIYLVMVLTGSFSPPLFMDISMEYDGDFYGYFFQPMTGAWRQVQYDGGEEMSAASNADTDDELVKSLNSFAM